jgi:hypothetical protein
LVGETVGRRDSWSETTERQFVLERLLVGEAVSKRSSSLKKQFVGETVFLWDRQLIDELGSWLIGESVGSRGT